MTDCTEHLQQLALVSKVDDAAAIYAVLGNYRRLQVRVRALEAERGDWQADARIEVRHRLGHLRLALERIPTALDEVSDEVRRALRDEGAVPDLIDLNIKDDDPDYGGEPYPTCPVCRDVLRAISEDEGSPRECPRHGRLG